MITAKEAVKRRMAEDARLEDSLRADVERAVDAAVESSLMSGMYSAAIRVDGIDPKKPGSELRAAAVRRMLARAGYSVVSCSGDRVFVEFCWGQGVADDP